MQTATNHPEMSAVDALWTLYRQQPKRVQEAFRIRLAQSETGEPKSPGRAKLIAHKTVMQEMEQMLETYAD